MKYTLLFSFIFALIGLTSCGIHKTTTGEVQHLGGSEKGTVRVQAAGYGVTKFLALENAEKNAFQALLFSGIPGSDYSKPMVANESETRALHSDWFRNFFEDRGYKKYLISSSSRTDFELMKVRQKNLEAYVKINVNALRSAMEQAGVIRKFGL